MTHGFLNRGKETGSGVLKSVGGPVMREYQDAKASGLIEPGIEALTDAFFEAGAAPLSSCEGHRTVERRRFGRVLRMIQQQPSFRPFVMFSASEAYARSFQKCYDQAMGTKRIHYCWIITGHFHPGNYELVWTLEPNDTRLDRGDVDTYLVHHDFDALAQIAIQAATKK